MILADIDHEIEMYMEMTPEERSEYREEQYSVAFGEEDYE